MVRESFIFYLCAISASIGSGFQHGYNAAILNAPQAVIEDWIKSLNIDYLASEEAQTLYWATIQSMFTVGGMIGGFISPLIILLGGRKGGLIISAFIAIIAGILMYVTKLLDDPLYLMMGRMVSGVNAGINGAICPVYLTEISPLKARGALGALYQLCLTGAILIGIFVSIGPALGTESLWPNLFLLVILVAALEIIGLMFVPESPRYILDVKDNEEKARKAFYRFHGHKPTADAEFSEIKAASAAIKSEEKLSLKIFLTQKMYYKPLSLCIFLMVAQQMSGINAVIFYSTAIFKKANMDELTSQLCTGGIGIINFLATCVAVAVIDKSGRKPLILWGFIFMAVCTALLTGFLYLTDYDWAKWLCFAVILLFIVCFAIGAGPIPWMLSSEVFQTNARPLAGAFIVPTNWFFNLVIVLGFPPIEGIIGPMVFLIFISFQIISVLVILIFMPETKNRSIEDVLQDFK